MASSEQKLDNFGCFGQKFYQLKTLIESLPSPKISLENAFGSKHYQALQ